MSYPDSFDSKSYKAFAHGVVRLEPQCCNSCLLFGGGCAAIVRCMGGNIFSAGFTPFDCSWLGLMPFSWPPPFGNDRFTCSRWHALLALPLSLCTPFDSASATVFVGWLFNCTGCNAIWWLVDCDLCASVVIRSVVICGSWPIVKLFMPSKIRISSTFGGRLSILISTKTRHSGHRSSVWLATIT